MFGTGPCSLLSCRANRCDALAYVIGDRVGDFSEGEQQQAFARKLAPDNDGRIFGKEGLGESVGRECVAWIDFKLDLRALNRYLHSRDFLQARLNALSRADNTRAFDRDRPSSKLERSDRTCHAFFADLHRTADAMLLVNARLHENGVRR